MAKPAIAEDSPGIDDQGTSSEEAAQILRSLRDNAGEGTIDGDVALKAKAKATAGGASVE
jgi:hypothetical protein